ncbi:MAG TPA: hypothetical protein VFW96_18835, partial [Thermomicrobiales bacterium]|nr:hypothetical protein [Thermomicrobiales bacterium]
MRWPAGARGARPGGGSTTRSATGTPIGRGRSRSSWPTARATPTLLTVEDIHWADDSSLACLLHLARRLPALPILLLLTYRDEAVTPQLLDFLAALDRERVADELTLGPLTLEETGAFLRAVFALDRPPRPDFLLALYALTEGNPFFIEEVLKALASSGDIFPAGSGWDRKPLGELRIPR